MIKAANKSKASLKLRRWAPPRPEKHQPSGSNMNIAFLAPEFLLNWGWAGSFAIEFIKYSLQESK